MPDSNCTVTGHVTSVADVVIGSSFLLVSLCALVLYIPCLKIIRNDNELSKHSCFTLMYHLGVCDLLHLGGQFIGGYFVITGLWYRVPFWLNRLLSTVIDVFGWRSYLAFIHCIALNRMVEMCASAQLKARLFSENATKKWIALCWMWGCVWFCVIISPWGGFMFYTDIYSFYFDTEALLYEFIKTEVKYEAMFQLFMSAFWYLLLYVSVHRQHGQVSHQNGQQADRERKIVKQAFIICIYPLIWDQWWHLAPVLSDGGFEYAYMLGNLLWISNSALNPIVYLTINKTISKKVGAMFGIRVNQVAVAPPANLQSSRSRRLNVPEQGI